MKVRNRTFLLQAASVLSLGFGFTAQASDRGSEPIIEPKVIYGDDDRRDMFAQDLDPRLAKLARSTAALIRKEDVRPDTTRAGHYKIAGETLEQSVGVCSTEPFHDQPAAAFCSGFLVGPDLFVTAGHCVQTQLDCNGINLVFNYMYDSPSRDPRTVTTQDVYSCKSIVSQFLDRTGASKLDYAVLKLDRPVAGREPLRVRREGGLNQGESVTVMGYPSGIPLKVAGGAATRSVEGEIFFTANLDTYGGNSGSAVLNTASGEVEGILVRGERDYVNQGGCLLSNRCGDSECRGEDVIKIANVLPFVPAMP